QPAPATSRGTDSSQPSWQVQFAWVKRTKKGWVSPKICRTKFTQPIVPNKDARTSFALRVSFDQLNPGLTCYGASYADGDERQTAQPPADSVVTSAEPTATSIGELRFTLQVLAKTTDTTNNQTYYLPLDAATVELTETMARLTGNIYTNETAASS